MCTKIRSDHKYNLRSIGTLGGGNHFIEINKDCKELEYVTIHSGSRSFGFKVCQHHQNKINHGKKFDWKLFTKECDKLKKRVKNAKHRKILEYDLEAKMKANLHTD